MKRTQSIILEILIIAGCVFGFATAGKPLVMVAYGWVCGLVIAWVIDLFQQ